MCCIGGEEFVIILFNIDFEGVFYVVENMWDSFELILFDYEGEIIKLIVSVGVFIIIIIDEEYV